MGSGLFAFQEHMDTTNTAPAPVEPQAPPPAPVSAVDAAVSEKNVSAFRDARRAEREGKPLPAVDVKAPEPVKPAEPVAPAQPDRTLSRRQQDANDRIRDAVERARTADAAEIARLRALVPATPAAPAPQTEAEYKRFLKLPDAPRLDQYDSVEEHTAAMALFISDKRYEERDEAAKQTAERTQTTDALRARDTAFQARISEAEIATPGYLDNLSDEIKSLRQELNEVEASA